MALFIYKGQDSKTGKAAKGQIEASSVQEAKARLRKQKILLYSIQEDRKAGGSTSKTNFLYSLTRKPPTVEDVAFASRQMSILINASVEIGESLKSVADQCANEELKSIYYKIRDLVNEGKSLSEAHREFTKTFSSIYVNMLEAAEKAGALPIVLKRLAEYLNYQIEIKRKLINALVMPAIMILAAIAITIYLFVSVLPKITKIFGAMKLTLPWYTLLLNRVSFFLQNHWIMGTILFSALCVSLFLWSKTAKGKRTLDYFFFRAPVFGPLIQKISVSRLSKTLSTVLSSGVRIIEALKLTKSIVGNAVLEDALETTLQDVQDGYKLGQALEKTEQFPVLMIQMVKTGEKTGDLETMLMNVADVYDEEVDNQITITMKLIQPIMLILMGGLIVVIVVAVVVPMMGAMNTVK
jgi:general secretion pathway protein F